MRVDEAMMQVHAESVWLSVLDIVSIPHEIFTHGCILMQSYEHAHVPHISHALWHPSAMPSAPQGLIPGSYFVDCGGGVAAVAGVIFVFMHLRINPVGPPLIYHTRSPPLLYHRYRRLRVGVLEACERPVHRMTYFAERVLCRAPRY